MASMESDHLDAGEFSSWLVKMRAALLADADARVPCDGCTACCTSSQFVHIGPEEHATLSRIPRQLLFAAPGLPAGHVVLGYDERGHCPMLVDGACSIYDERPRTCRTYDCRVFSAADTAVPNPSAPDVADRVRRWRFSFSEGPEGKDHAESAAVRAAAAYLGAHAASLPSLTGPTAVGAVELYDLFLDGPPSLQNLRAEMIRRRVARSEPESPASRGAPPRK
jgi:hypothetical protein